MSEKGGAAAAVNALTAKAKLARMWREKVDQHNTGSPVYERIERVVASVVEKVDRVEDPELRRRPWLPSSSRSHRDAGGWNAGLDSGIDQVARRFRHRVGGRSADPERSASRLGITHTSCDAGAAGTMWSFTCRTTAWRRTTSPASVTSTTGP